MNKLKVLEYLLHICDVSNEIILEIYNKDFEVEYKSDQSPLTIADKKVSDYICNALKIWDATIPIICEETKLVDYEERKHWDRYWLVDPLDGTKEFVKRNGEFTVNIALIEGGEPTIGVISVPVKGDFYCAAKGKGAFKLNSKDIVKLECEPFEMWKPLTAVCSRSHLDEKTKELMSFFDIKDTVSCGSSLKFMMLCENKAQIYPRLTPCMEWDIGAAHIILNEAGGCMRQLFDEKVQYNKPNLLVPMFFAYSKLV